MSEWTKVTSATDSFQAEVVAGRLHDGGIETQTMKSAAAPGAWLTGNENAFGPIDVFVPNAQLPAARELLGDFEPGPIATRDDRPATSTLKIGIWILVIAMVVAVGASVLLDLLN